MRILTSHRVLFSVRDFNTFPQLSIHICRRMTFAGNRCTVMPFIQPLRQFRKEQCGMMKLLFYLHADTICLHVANNAICLQVAKRPPSWEFFTDVVIARHPL